jgi:hypothetical protein
MQVQRVAPSVMAEGSVDHANARTLAPQADPKKPNELHNT